MIELETLREKLQDRRLSVISAATGLHYNTLAAFKNGINHTLTATNWQKLSAYFEGQG